MQEKLEKVVFLCIENNFLPHEMQTNMVVVRGYPVVQWLPKVCFVVLNPENVATDLSRHTEE